MSHNKIHNIHDWLESKSFYLLDGCIEHLNIPCKRNGYVYVSNYWFSKKLKVNLAHQLSYVLHNGDYDRSLVVRHLCHNKRCINPKHLKTGAHKENIQDSIRDGRFTKGERQGFSKITSDDVKEIRRLHSLGLTSVEISKRFPISPTQVSCIHRRIYWKHVQ